MEHQRNNSVNILLIHIDSDLFPFKFITINITVPHILLFIRVNIMTSNNTNNIVARVNPHRTRSILAGPG